MKGLSLSKRKVCVKDERGGAKGRVNPVNLGD